MAVQLQIAGSKSKLSLSTEAFAGEYNEPLVHQVVTAYMNQARRGTKAQKNRAAVAGGGAKPWRQKGTGRARAGTTRGPIWVGGGRAFAAKPRKFDQKVNKKMYQGAMRSLIAELIRNDRLVAVETLNVTGPKTRDLVSRLAELDAPRALILIEAFDENVHLAARNLPHVDVMEVAAVDPVSLLRYEKVLVTVAAAKLLEEMFK